MAAGVMQDLTPLEGLGRPLRSSLVIGRLGLILKAGQDWWAWRAGGVLRPPRAGRPRLADPIEPRARGYNHKMADICTTFTSSAAIAIPRCRFLGYIQDVDMRVCLLGLYPPSSLSLLPPYPPPSPWSIVWQQHNHTIMFFFFL